MSKLVVNKSNQPAAVLVAVEYTKSAYPLKKEDGQATNLIINGTSFGTVPGICRLLARAAPALGLYGSGPLERTEVDHWLEFSAGRLNCQADFTAAVEYLDQVLGPVTFLVGHNITIADIAVWGTLRGSDLWHSMIVSGNVPQNLERYYKFLSAQENFQTVDKKLPAVTMKKEAVKVEGAKKERKEEGKFVDLPGAKMGEVVVRFPPEASGYLHVGHAKAALLNQYYQQTFKGKLIMRFDDTNPAKESSEFEKVILEDLELLGIKYDIFSHTSDHFDLIMSYCEKMMREGTAYVDTTDAETIKAEREQRAESKCRNNTPEQNFALWEKMKKATEEGVKCCVRAKIDMNSNNGCMRDPTIYRCKPEPHVRTGTKYKVYPTYDFACPIVDSIEGVTHSLRTTEYHDRDDQFYWFIDQLGLRRPHIWEYARLNLQNTVMSKRKLTWFVNEKLVEGWDDPRFPTVRGVMRHGMTVEGLKQFVISQGGSRSVVMMEWDKIWSFNKKVIDPIVPRYTALLKDEAVTVNVSSVTEEVKDVQKHPKDPAVGMKQLWYGPTVYIDGADAESLHVGENVTFINWGNLIIKKINRNAAGRVESVDADPNLSNTDFKKTQKCTWLAVTEKAPLVPTVCIEYDNIITKPVLDKEDDFKNFINKNSKTESVMFGDPMLATLKKGEIIQLQRRGYFICDAAYEPPSRHSGRASPCILIFVPDGHTKEMPKAGSKHKTGPVEPVPSAKEKAQSKKGKAAEKSPMEEKAPSVGGDVNGLLQKISDQGNKIRKLKSEKSPKEAVMEEVKVLQALKAEYKSLTGKDWTPDAASVATPAPVKAASSPADSANVTAVLQKITEQGNQIRKLKSEKAAKEVVMEEVKTLQALKAEYKTLTGKDWTPDCAKAAPAVAATHSAAPSAAPASASADVLSLLQKITDQGNKIRKLKSEKAPKDAVMEEVKTLQALKADYKAKVGKDWTPDAANAAQTSIPASSAAATAVPAATGDVSSLLQKITDQGNKIRKLKSEKAAKETVMEEVKTLQGLKADYKSATGSEWTPDAAKAASAPAAVPETAKAAPGGDGQTDKLKSQIDAQGLKVRDLKSSGAAKAEIDAEVKVLLNLKAQYKDLTGQDLPGGGGNKKGKKDKQSQQQKQQPKKEEKAKPVEEGADRELKKITRLGIEAKKEEDLPEWYSQVITKAEMIEYYDVSGCYVLRPWAFGIWEAIQAYYDAAIKSIGFSNCYFPMFVSGKALETEKEHIDDFAPEVAWVTKSGTTELAEPIAIRPTSETVMYASYSRWVQSHRDLPIKLNQWCNVVRWEFKHPQPFLRTREFLWQEGHSAYATYKEAEEEVHWVINQYEYIYEHLLAIPVVKGRKTEKEKFAGADFTTTVEAYIGATGRGIQAATSHHLGQNFSKMFDISFEDPVTAEKQYAYQNSWAITTRSIGVIVMVHGDDKGLVLPPRIAVTQVIIVPCGITVNLSDADRKKLMDECDSLCKTLCDVGVKAKTDLRDNYSPGWKFNHWELKGVPIRVELGPRDLKQEQFVAVRRDTGEKLTLKRNACTEAIKNLLETIHNDMFARAKKDRDEHLVKVFSFEDFCRNLDKKCLLLAPFCGGIPCEEKIKELSARDAVVEEGAPAMGAKGLCSPFNQPEGITPETKCINPECKDKAKTFTLFGRSY